MTSPSAPTPPAPTEAAPGSSPAAPVAPAPVYATVEDLAALASRVAELEAKEPAPAAAAGPAGAQLVTATHTPVSGGDPRTIVGFVIEDHDANDGVLIAEVAPFLTRIPRSDVTPLDTTTVPGAAPTATS